MTDLEKLEDQYPELRFWSIDVPNPHFHGQIDGQDVYVNANGQDVITPYIVPHFWRWSKKFMNLQYVMIHKELNIGV